MIPQLSSVQFSRSVMSDSLRPHELQHTRPPCASPTPRVHSNSCPSSQWCHPAISSSVVPFSSCPQSLPASGSFPVSQLLAWGGQSIGVSASASVLPMTIQGWSYRMDWVDLLAVQRTLKHLLHTTVLPSGTFWFMRIINIPYLALSLLSTTLGLEILSLEIVLPPILTKKNFFFFFFYPSLGIPATAIQFFRHFTSVVRFGKKFSRIRVSPGRRRAFSRA